MGDGRAEWRFRGALRIDVNPLIVVRRLGEIVDTLLCNRQSISHGHFFADPLVQLFAILKRLNRHWGTSKFW